MKIATNELGYVILGYRQRNRYFDGFPLSIVKYYNGDWYYYNEKIILADKVIPEKLKAWRLRQIPSVVVIL